MRIRLQLETPGFVVKADGLGAARKVAEAIQKDLTANYEKGKDGRGRNLPAVKQATIDRRRRRREQRSDDSGAKKQRYKVRGGGSFDSIDPQTPFHESGLAAEKVVVRFKGRDSGDPVFLIAGPSGGKKRGLINDDGRGARLFAVDHYGFERMYDLPRQSESKIDQILDVHFSDALNAGAGLLGSLGDVGSSFGELGGIAGDIAESGE